MKNFVIDYFSVALAIDYLRFTIDYCNYLFFFVVLGALSG